MVERRNDAPLSIAHRLSLSRFISLFCCLPLVVQLVVQLAVQFAVQLAVQWGGISQALSGVCSVDFKLFVRTTPIHVEEKVSLAGFEGYEALYLGQGVGGGKVYRVTTLDRSSTFVIKDYVFGDRYDATNDVTALKIIDQVTRGTIAERGMRPIQVLDRIDETRVKLEYAAGTDLRQLASTATAEHRKDLARLFRRHLESLRRNLLRNKTILMDGIEYQIQDLVIQNSTTLGFNDLIGVIKAPNPYGEPIHVRLWIKPENVVMNSEGRFFIIDPR